MFIAVLILFSISFICIYLDYRSNVSLYKQVIEIEAIEDSGEAISDEQQAVLEEWESKNILFDPDKEALQKKIEIMSKGTYLEVIESEKGIVRMMHTDIFYPKKY